MYNVNEDYPEEDYDKYNHDSLISDYKNKLISPDGIVKIIS